MTTIPEVQDLAAELQALRPDWPDIIPIVNHLLPWRHLPYDDLRAMTTAWVKDHGNRTPASLKYMPGVPLKQAGSSSSPRKSKEPDLCVCGERHERRPMVIDEPPVDSPERTTAKARARAAAEAARQKSKWKPAPPPDDRRIQEREAVGSEEPQPEEAQA